MAEGLQYKENLSIISGGYKGEDVGSSSLVKDWTDVPSLSGSSTVTYHYMDSVTGDNNNATRIEVKITDSWTAVRDDRNYYRITVKSVIDSIRRVRVGSPSAFSVSMFVRRTKNSAVLWKTNGCVDATVNSTHATNIDLGTATIVLPPGHADDSQGTIYYRSNACGHNNTNPPSSYVDEFWLGINFRNTLPPDYRPGKVLNPSGTWLSTNRTGGKCHILTGNLQMKELRTINGPNGTDNPPYIRHNDGRWHNQRLIGKQ